MSSSSGASKFQELLKNTLSSRGIGLHLPFPEETEVERPQQVGSNGIVQRISSTKQQNVLDDLKISLRQKVIETKRASLSTTSDFETLYRLLCSSPTMNYDDFLQYGTKAPVSTQRFFTSQTFLMFPKDKRGGILVESFLRFVQRSIDVELVCLQLIGHGKESNYPGYINEQELERFILNRIPEIGACKDLPESFYPYYVFTASRRFLFFLDARRTRRISIKKLAHSAVMEELLFLQRISGNNHCSSSQSQSHHQVNDQIASNWFSSSNALRVFSLYVELDKDQNGMLNQEELTAFTGPPNEQIQLTSTAIRRIFEENITYQPMEMDYKTFLDLYLALEYKSTIEAMSYFWRVLDIDKCGRLTPNAIKYFYSDIYESLRATGYEAPSVENVIIEIYDILACSSDPKFQDFITSEQGHTVISMLLDVNGFWQYDNRESLMQHTNTAAEETVFDEDGFDE